MSSTEHLKTETDIDSFAIAQDSGATTSPTQLQSTESSITSPINTVVADASAPTSALPPLSGDAANQSATASETAAATTANGGESVAPVTTTGTQTPSETTAGITPVAQTQTESTSMHTEEPKLAGSLAKPDDTSKEVETEADAEDTGPSLVITLLLTTGSRHPFTIDGKYLRKRNVNVENHDPFAMSVYTLKELIWREWRDDWEPRPSSPSSIRLISFGKLLVDKSPLSESKFNHDAPNVLHMTVKPQEIVDEEDAKGAKAQYNRENETSERSPGCRCVIL
ncbi:hypothetical protein N7495_005911 [Penicillium taxi]|uniref:uncharacterized protein n=1 Tax=Penicillium taxi TaxID=168475 RepID=UPI002544E84B|nr:uncharacterized protein N7495_005911 [Penicillium taxi]KAJ5894220.1 hypothetical protein N7495_005911 [Penicillium taxi]